MKNRIFFIIGIMTMALFFESLIINSNVHAGKMMQDGPYKFYYGNEQIRAEGVLKNGKNEGSYKAYYRNGQLKVATTFKDGQPEGLYVIYYENGQVAEEVIFKNGRPQGLYVSYYQDGKLEMEIPFTNGIGGQPKYYDKEGKLQEYRPYNSYQGHFLYEALLTSPDNKSPKKYEVEK